MACHAEIFSSRWCRYFLTDILLHHGRRDFIFVRYETASALNTWSTWRQGVWQSVRSSVWLIDHSSESFHKVSQQKWFSVSLPRLHVK